ncbi:hypothetical protein BGX34_010789 [Mortierella sp. NVP85]|nr:hypothetical protein BGX34_010789 [Mortierella sp. NVP85]
MAATPKYAAKTLRTLKNFSKGYTDMQARVREATSNDPWGPSGTQMNELAMATHNPQDFVEIMEILDKRLNDKGKNWRHVFKALTVLDYLLHVGSEDVVRYARDNIYIVKTLKEFQYIDDDGKDQGSNVRQKAKDITALLSDEARLREERRSRNAMRDRMSGRAPGDYDAQTPVYDRPGYGDDDRDLQRALEESKRTAQSENKNRNSEDEDLQKALELSRREEQDRLDNVKKYNEFSMTEGWEADNKPTNQYEQQNNNTDFFANDFGQTNNNNFDGFGLNNGFNAENAFLQQQPTGFNNPYLQLQQQQLQQQQLQQQQMMQQQMMQQQLQQQQQMAFLNSMNNPYQQQQMMPQITGQVTGAPAIGSNNPFSAFAQKPAMTGQPFSTNNNNGFNTSNGFDSGLNSGFNSNLNNGFSSGLNNGFNSGLGNGLGSNSNTNTNANNSSSLGELSFLQDSMTRGSSPPVSSQPAIAKTLKPNDEKYAHLAMALQGRDDSGVDTFGNVGALRFPAHHGMRVASQSTGVSNPFQGTRDGSLIDVGDSGSSLLRSNTNNPFQATNNGFLSSQATGFGSGNGNMFNQLSAGQTTSGGAYGSNSLF